MNKKLSKVDRIASMFLDQYDLKEELDSLTHFIFSAGNNLFELDNGRIITREELNKRTKRKIEILSFVLEKARETTLSKENRFIKNLKIIECYYI